MTEFVEGVDPAGEPDDDDRARADEPSGDDVADLDDLEALLEACMAELRRIARSKMRGQRGDHTLQTTALINEAYLKLRHQSAWKSREHFLAVAIRAMRQILIDHARTRGRAKRPNAKNRVPLDFADVMAGRLDEANVNIVPFDAALDRLQASGPKGAEAMQIVVLRLYGDLALPEVAELLQISLRTVERRWQYARAWLHDELDG